jgi:hypothetical protein
MGWGCYTMSFFLLPISCYKELDKAFKIFFWGFPSKKTRNLSLKAWDSICIPKALGGLGIRKMREVNLALISKLGWKLLSNPDSLWVAQLKGKYLHSKSFLSPPSFSSSFSWLWKCILNSHSFISKGACNLIHSSSSLPIWSSPWIPTLNTFTPSPSPLLQQPLPNLIISDLFISTSPQSAVSWNMPMLHSLFDALSITEILKINFSSILEDKLIWTPAANGKFSTKSAHSIISSQRIFPTDIPLSPSQWKLFWKLNLNDRLKLFLWKIAWDIVPSKSRLNAVFSIPASNLICPLCKVEEDSLSHLFFNCFFARIAWRFSYWPLDSMKWTSLSLVDWIKGILTPNLSFGIPLADLHLFQIFAAVLCDLLWFSRNQAVHKGEIPDALKLAEKIKKVTSEHFAAWSLKKKIVKEKWSKPPLGFCKVNFDTAIREDFSAQAAVCRDSNGVILKVLSQILPSCSPVFGEALAAQLASDLASFMKLDQVIIEGDSSVVISSLQNPSCVLDWHIDLIIKDTISSFPASSLWEARKINRSANFCAHYAAYRAAARVLPGCIPSLVSPPSSIPICSGKDPPFSFPYVAGSDA